MSGGTGTPSPAIRRRGPAERSAGFEGLRRQGIEAIQALCGETWTDHNLHDPGITILEQLCYALTELAYRARFPVEDQLCDADGRLNLEALSLHRPGEVFPCRATTAADQRLVLLDLVPGLDDAALEPLLQAPVRGLYRMRLELSDDAPESVAERIAAARAAFRSQRTLGEDLDAQVLCVERQPCELVARIEIGGPRDAADVLADVLHAAARVVARTPRRRGLRDLLAAGRSFEQVFGGPVLRHGRFADTETPPPMLYVADVAARVRAVDGVLELRKFALGPPGRPTTGALPWRDDGRVLALALPAAGQLPPSVQLTRHGHPVEVSPAALAARLRLLAAQERTARARRGDEDQGDELQALPRGRPRPAPPYTSVQTQFPAIYGLAPHGVPPHEGPLAEARARQLAAYLMLFEQVIAHAHAQLAHLPQLFSAGDGSARSQWWQMLDERTLPGLTALYTQPPEQVQREVYEPFDAAPGRKSRVLDHLLALYGESLPQDSLRQFCGHLTAAELDARLLRDKAAWLADVVTLARDRAAGWDDAQPAWNEPANTPGLLRRAALLLGFRHTVARPLAAGLRRRGLRVEEDDAPLPPERAAAAEARSAPMAGLDLQAMASPAAADAAADALLLPFAGRLDAAFFRAAVVPGRYRLHQAAPGDWRLALGPDEHGRWWDLGRHADDATARQRASALRQSLLALHEDAEGLHLVEHVLLRPSAGDPPPEDRPFHALQLSVVLPAWTVRTRQPSFRAFAQDTLRAQAPLHLALRCLWLSMPEMERFERACERWMACRRTWHAAGQQAGEVSRRLDEAAAALLRLLRTLAEDAS